MKKVFLLLFCLATSLLFSQERSRGDIEVIPFIAYQSSVLNGDEIQGLSSRSSVAFGAKGDYYFNDRWSLRSGIEYISMGAKQSSNKLKLNYINVPVNANWHFGSTRKWNLNFGVTPGFLTSGKVNDTNVKDSYQSFQLAISYGIGYKLTITDNFSLLIDGQGLFGVTNILKEGDFTRLNAGSNIGLGGVFTF